MTHKALDHIRVLDLTAWQAGPTLTMNLADFGADVIKIEAPSRIDGWRGGAGLMANKAYERNPIWNAVNRNKRGISLDLKLERGRELFLELVKQADLVVENYTPRVMENFNLGYDVLRGVNPRIIMIALSGFGATGPWRDYSAFAFPTEEVSGITYLNGRPGGPPRLIGGSVTDGLAGAMGTYAVLAALWNREKTGLGDYIDLSQIEALTTFLAPELIEAQVTGQDPERRGNRRPGFGPHGIYPCQPEGHWVAIAVKDSQWMAFRDAIGQRALFSNERFVNPGLRQPNAHALDEIVSEWTRPQTGAGIVETLQAAGIAAAVCSTPTELLNDEQLWAREFYTVLDREEVGAHPYPGPMIRLRDTPATLERPSPLYGQHTVEVLTERLGLTAEDFAALEAAGVTSKDPAAQDWR